MHQYMKFISAMFLAGGLASCSQNYVALETGDYDFKSNPYTMPEADLTFKSPREVSIYNNEVEERGDLRLCDLCADRVDNSISYALAIVPVNNQKSKNKNKRSNNSKNTKATKSQKTSDPASRPPIVHNYDKYPKFNSPMAVTLWKMMRRSDTFTQSDISNAIELCIVAYDYLTQEYQEILGHNYSEAKRRDCLVDLDNGKGSEIMNFTNTFSRRLNKLSDLSEANLSRLQMMNEKKAQNHELLNKVVNP